MRIFALQLDNDRKGIEGRKKYIEALISKLPCPDFVVLPELAVCSYMASREIWKYADDCGKDTSEWAVQLARKYNTFIGVGYLDKEGGDYYNRYMIVGKDGVCGTVTKSEGEAAVFKRGDFGNIIETPFGNVAVASMILFPHGSPADPKKPEKELQTNDYFCRCYESAFQVPVVYVNSIGGLEYMPGKMGELMKKAGFTMNGRTKIYSKSGASIECEVPEAYGVETDISPRSCREEISFFGDDIRKGNWFFRRFILKPDVKRGIQKYEADKK